MVMRDLCPHVTVMGFPWMRFGTLKIGWRCTLIKLRTGSVAVFLPGPLTENIQSEGASFGACHVYLDSEQPTSLVPVPVDHRIP